MQRTDDPADDPLHLELFEQGGGHDGGTHILADGYDHRIGVFQGNVFNA